jgi:hypothetical protein
VAPRRRRKGLAFWWVLLRQLARMDLELAPAHPDGVGGLGYLEIAYTRFAALAFAISLIVSAIFAEDIASGRNSLGAVCPALFLTLLIDFLLLVAPLCVFTFRLRACQEKGLRDYTELSSRYVSSFERKWIRNEGPQPLLGTPDLQSLADLANSVTVVRKTRRSAPDCSPSSAPPRSRRCCRCFSLTIRWRNLRRCYCGS